LETEVRQDALLAALGLGKADAEQLEPALREQYARTHGPDAELLEVVHRQVDFLAEALRGAVNVFNPELIILGGFLGILYALEPTRITDAVKSRSIAGPREDVGIARAELGSALLLVGAAQLAFAPFLADPASILESAAARV
jgi:predicted NBD/HSP70 family sugar kinase